MKDDEGNEFKDSYGDCYADAIPMDKLIKLAKEDINACGATCEKSIRVCAEKVVLANVCPCVVSASPIVDSVVDEYMRQMNNKS